MTPTLDLTGYSCPMTMMRTKAHLKLLAPDGVAVVLCGDPDYARNLTAWCRVNPQWEYTQQHDLWTIKKRA